MKRLSLILGSLFGAGYLPVFPGTWASLISLLPVYFVSIFFSDTGLLLLLLTVTTLSLLTSDTCVRAWGEDPSRFVLDEFAGQSIPFLFIPFGHTFTTDLMILFTGFILFRIFDIIKPLGIDRLQKFPGKFGILLDDIAAGVYAFVCLHSVIYLANLLF